MIMSAYENVLRAMQKGEEVGEWLEIMRVWFQFHKRGWVVQEGETFILTEKGRGVKV
jgi:hypothetical protein